MTSPSSSSKSIKSHSSSPRKPAPWQTSGTYSKKSAQSSLSLVFAQPESGASLPAAVDRLPVHRVLSATSMKPVENSRAQDAKAVDQTKTASVLATEPHVDKLEEEPDERQSNVVKATSGSIAEYEPEATEPSNAPTHHHTSQAPVTAIATEPSPERAQGQPSDRSTSNTVSQEEPSGGITADTHESLRPKKHRSDTVLSSKRSWFSSLSRVRSAERPPEDPAPASPPVPANHNSVSEPALPIPSDSPDFASTSAHVIIADASRSPPPSAAVPVSPSQPTSSPATGSTSSSPNPRRSWFGSMSSAPPSSVSQVPALPSMPDGPTTPMSIDEEVPKLQHADDAAPHAAPPIIISDESTPRLSSLNPSTSRYALSIPLLGRPKIPLDKALASAKAADIRDPSPAPPERVARSESVAIGTTNREKLAESGELAEGDRVDNLPEGRESDKVVGTNLAPNTPASSSSSSTWWGLVGWGSSTDSLGSRVVAEDMRPKDIPDSAAATPDVPVLLEAAPTGPVQTQGAAPTGPVQTQAALHEPPPEPEWDPDAPTKAMSAMSNDTQRSSTWYAPWTWYGSGIAPTDDAATKPGQTDMDMDGLTPAEAVKEAALARDEPVAPTQSASAPDRSDIAPARPAAPPATSDSSSSDRNPIQSTIAMNLHGWSAFFSSRTLGAKRVTDTERNENGMEVMDVPDPEEDDGEAKLVATSAGDGKEKVATKMTTQKGKVTTQTTVEGQQVMTTTEAEKTSKQAAVAKQNGATATEREVKQTTTTTTIQTETKPSASGSKGGKEKLPSRSSSKGRSGRASPVGPKPAPPNLVLPAWHETFELPPRSLMPTAPPSVLQRTIKIVSGLSGFLSKDDAGRGRKIGKGKGHARSASTMSAPETELYMAKELPRAWKAMEDLPIDEDVLKGCRRVIVLGIHGWFPGAVMRSVIGEPTGTSSKFATMMCQALDAFQEKHGVKLEKVTACPLEGEGTIEKRVEKLYESLTSNEEWMKDLHAADAIFVACHSQGSIVSTHLLDRLIQDKHIRTSRLADVLGSASAAVTSAGGSVHAPRPPQRVCCLALCGIHLGPLRYLSSSSVLQPYFQYFESAAARQLFEFQNTESEVSKNYVAALTRVLDHGTKMLYIASLNDQVVPIYSGIFTAAHHPLILRALYIDGDAYNSSDFLTNLLVLLTRILNAGLSDSGLAMHLSEATAGTLNGIGHSTAYEEPEVYSLAADYLFMTNQGLEEHPELMVEPFSASAEQNDYEIPWRLRDLIADGRVHELFGSTFADLRDAFPHWQPKSAILRDVKRKLQPIQRLSTFSPSSPPLSPRSSKL